VGERHPPELNLMCDTQDQSFQATQCNTKHFKRSNQAAWDHIYKL